MQLSEVCFRQTDGQTPDGHTDTLIEILVLGKCYNSERLYQLPSVQGTWNQSPRTLQLIFILWVI